MHGKLLYPLITVAAFALACTGEALAQAEIDEHKFEIGGHYTAIGFEDFSTPLSGFGARAGYNFNQHLALDAEFSFFPETKLGNDQGGQDAQGFVGVRAGARSKYAGLFAKLRPGVMSIGEITSGFDCAARTGFTVCRPSHTHFALDAGAVLEFYPTGRAIIRVDAGDTIVRLRNAGGRNILGPAPAATTRYTHNLQAGVGVGYRF